MCQIANYLIAASSVQEIYINKNINNLSGNSTIGAVVTAPRLIESSSGSATPNREQQW
jgi:hypothetical protein